MFRVDIATTMIVFGEKIEQQEKHPLDLAFRVLRFGRRGGPCFVGWCGTIWLAFQSAGFFYLCIQTDIDPDVENIYDINNVRRL
jgi:hypothetical protein